MRWQHICAGPQHAGDAAGGEAAGGRAAPLTRHGARGGALLAAQEHDAGGRVAVQQRVHALAAVAQHVVVDVPAVPYREAVPGGGAWIRTRSGTAGSGRKLSTQAERSGAGSAGAWRRRRAPARPPHLRSTVSNALGRKRPLTISRCVPSSEPLVPSSDSRNCCGRRRGSSTRPAGEASARRGRQPVWRPRGAREPEKPQARATQPAGRRGRAGACCCCCCARTSTCSWLRFMLLHSSIKLVNTVFLVPSRATCGGLSVVRRRSPVSSGLCALRMPNTRSAGRGRRGRGWGRGQGGGGGTHQPAGSAGRGDGMGGGQTLCCSTSGQR